MATVDENLATFLKTDNTVLKLSQGRICENHVPQGPNGPYLPYIFFYLSADVDDPVLAGNAGAQANRHQFFIECYGQKVTASRELGNAVTARLRDYKGAFGTQTAQGVFVNSVGDDYEPRGNGGDTGIHGAHYAVEVVA